MSNQTNFLPDDKYDFLGETFTVRSNSLDVLDYVRSVYGRFYVRDGTPTSKPSEQRPTAPVVLEVVDRLDDAKELVVRDNFGSCTLRCKDLHSLDTNGNSPDITVPYPLAYVEGRMLRNLARVATDYCLIHAGSMSSRDRAVIFPGISGRGKTTLCLKLLGHGFKLLSDEVAFVHRDQGIVEPFPRLVKIDEQSRRFLKISPSKVTKGMYPDGDEVPWLLDVEDAFPSGVGGSARLLYIVLLDGFAETTRLEPISQVRALLALSKLNLCRSENDAAADLFTFAPFLENVRCFNLVMGDLEEAATMIRTLVDDAVM